MQLPRNLRLSWEEHYADEQIKEATATQLYAIPATIDIEVPAMAGTTLGVTELDANGTGTMT